MQTEHSSITDPPPTATPARPGRFRVLNSSWFIIGLSAAVTFFGVWLGRTWIVSGFANGHLEIDDFSLDFGTVWEQADFDWTVLLHNPTSRDIQIDRFLVSCRCTEVEPKSLLLKAGETRELRLRLDLRQSARTLEMAGAGNFSVQFAPVVRDGLPENRGWTIRGSIRRAYEFTPSSLTFGESLVEGQEWPSIQVQVQPKVELQSLNAVCKPSDFATATVELGESPGTYRLQLTPISGSSVGLHKFDVVLSGSTKDETLPPTPVAVEMRVLADLQWLPSHVVFGSLPIGKTVEETVVLSSRTGREFEVLTATATAAPGLSIERLPDGDGQKVFRIRQQVLALETQTKTVSVSVRYNLSQTQMHSKLPISYFGINHRDSTSP